jgi:hypothetical protein
VGATFVKRGKSFRITVAQGGERATITIRSKGDAESLCREIRKRELAGENIVQSIRSARFQCGTPDLPTFPPLKTAIEGFIESQVKAGELRQSSATNYHSRCRKWLFRVLGSTPIDQVTREEIGQIIRTIS